MQRETELLWRSEKYRVMYHSQNHYNEIRRLMREQAPFEHIQQMIADALAIPPTSGAKINAIQHMWGYFKKFATADEKNMYKTLLDRHAYEELLQFLKQLSHHYNVRYLQESTLLQ